MKVLLLCITVAGAFGLWGYNIGRLEPMVYTTNAEVAHKICKGADSDSDLIQACRLAKDVIGEDYKTETVVKAEQ